MKYFLLTVFLLTSCSYLPKNLKLDEEILWQNELYKVYSNEKKQVIIGSSQSVAEEVYFSNNINFDISLLKTKYIIKCSPDRSLLYNKELKLMALVKDQEVLMFGKSELVDYHIYTDQNKKCLNSWGH